MYMRHLFFSLSFFCILNLSAAENPITHYTTDNLRLRSSDVLTSSIITTLPQYTAFRIIETGKTERIDGITAPWVKVITQTGYTGWCFSGYISPIESNVIEDIALSFSNTKSGSFPGINQRLGWEFFKRGDTSITGLIRNSNGYYIQQHKRGFQGRGRTPEILALSYEDGKVYIREVDIIDGQTIIKNEIILNYNGITYGNSKTYLVKYGDGIAIMYLEHKLDSPWGEPWDYEVPYTYTSSLSSVFPDNLYRLTTDYLKSFAGTYEFDSYKILRSENSRLRTDLVEQSFVEIVYNQEEKCLALLELGLTAFVKWQRYFIETTPEDPFYWTFGEGVGFTEEKYFFYKGGIAFTYEHTKNDEYLKYVVFYKKPLDAR